MFNRLYRAYGRRDGSGATEDEVTEIMIGLVSHENLLWDKKNKDFKNVKLKAVKWAKIGEELDWGDGEAAGKKVKEALLMV